MLTGSSTQKKGEGWGGGCRKGNYILTGNFWKDKGRGAMFKKPKMTSHGLVITREENPEPPMGSLTLCFYAYLFRNRLLHTSLSPSTPTGTGHLSACYTDTVQHSQALTTEIRNPKAHGLTRKIKLNAPMPAVTGFNVKI